MLGFRFVKMIQGFVRFLYGSKGTFHLAFRTSGYTLTVLSGRQMSQPVNPQRQHDVLENPTFSHGAIIEVKHFGSPHQRKRRLGLGCHGGVEESQCRPRILAVNTVIFLISHTTPIINHAEQHQRGFTFIGVDPLWHIDMLQIGR
ncbi:hypothetical protein D3C76_944470 [compost metagenome]